MTPVHCQHCNGIIPNPSRISAREYAARKFCNHTCRSLFRAAISTSPATERKRASRIRAAKRKLPLATRAALHNERAREPVAVRLAYLRFMDPAEWRVAT